jgi:hypothetical protein
MLRRIKAGAILCFRERERNADRPGLPPSLNKRLTKASSLCDYFRSLYYYIWWQYNYKNHPYFSLDERLLL